MAQNTFDSTMNSLFQGLGRFISTKTVVGEPVRIDNAILIPLVDVSCGLAAGSFAGSSKDNAGGGMNAKISPAAVLIIQNGVTKLINVKSQDPVTKVLDLVPDIVNKFTADRTISEETVAEAQQIVSGGGEEKA